MSDAENSESRGEDKFQNYGIVESGKRDAKLVKNRRAAVIGGGDAALENALILAETAREVYLIHRRQIFRGRTEFLDRIYQNKKIKIFTETALIKFGGGEKLEFAELRNSRTGEKFTLPIEKALVRIGVEPNTELFTGELKMDKRGYIKTNAVCETSAAGVFAVGDAANSAFSDGQHGGRERCDGSQEHFRQTRKLKFIILSAFQFFG